MFDRKGLVAIPASQTDEDTLMELALYAGAEVSKRVGDNFEITCDPNLLTKRDRRRGKSRPQSRDQRAARIPKDTVDLDAGTARSVLKLMDALDDHDDVQKVAANFNIPDEAMAQIEAG